MKQNNKHKFPKEVIFQIFIGGANFDLEVLRIQRTFPPVAPMCKHVQLTYLIQLLQPLRLSQDYTHDYIRS